MKSIFGVEVAAVSLVDYEEISFHARAGEWACKGGRSGSFCGECATCLLKAVLLAVWGVTDHHRTRPEQPAASRGLVQWLSAACALGQQQ